MVVGFTAWVKLAGGFFSALRDPGPAFDDPAVPAAKAFGGFKVSICVLENGSLNFGSRGEFRSDPRAELCCTVAVEEPITRIGSEPLFVDGIGLCIVAFGLFTEIVSSPAASLPRFTMSFTFPTDALILVYSPLKPPWSSLAIPFESGPEEEDGGDVYSLKVVRASLRLAELWIWSSACESVSLSTFVLLAREANEPRREFRS